MTEKRTLLLIGGAGFLGAHVATAATAAGLAVVAATRDGTEAAPPCDLLDPASLAACIETVRPDLVVNAAGSASVGRSWEHPAETFAANATGVLNLLEAVTGGAGTPMSSASLRPTSTACARSVNYRWVRTGSRCQ